MSADLPPGVRAFLEFLAGKAAGYDNVLQSAEEARLKADLMNNRRYWVGVEPSAVRAAAIELGMRHEDVRTIIDLVTRALAGSRLVANRFYRDYKFPHDRYGPPPTRPMRPVKTTMDWTGRGSD